MRAVWVINARSLITVVHATPGPGEHGRRQEVSGNRPVAPGFAPELAVTLDKLEPA